MLRLLALLLACPCLAADPEKPVVVARTVPPAGVQPKPVQLDPWVTSQRFVALVPTTDEPLTYDYSDPEVVTVVTRKPGEPFFGVPFDAVAGAKSTDHAYTQAKGPVGIVVGEREGTCTVTVWGVKDGKAVKIDTVQIVVGPRPPPPIPPGPTPPGPVTSFRVIYVTESATNLTVKQNAVVNAAEVVKYLNSHCTKTNNWPDWRSYDPQTVAEKDYAGLAAMWTATKPALTTIPCVAIQVNEKITIEPFPADATAALTLFRKYGGQ